MTPYSKYLIVFLLGFISLGCGDKEALKNNFSLTTDAKKNTITKGEAITFSLKAKKELSVDSVAYFVNDHYLTSQPDASTFTTTLDSKKLGYKNVEARIYTPDGATSASVKVIILNDKAPNVYGYTIVNRFPHRTDAYTQGLEFAGDTLYESNGQRKESNLRMLDYKTGKILLEEKLDDAYFAEGMTIMGDKIYQLTWQEKTGFIYDRHTFKSEGAFGYGQSKEGWGLANDGTQFYKSDGTTKIWTLDPNTLAEKSYIEPTSNKSVTTKLNELEWVNGKIYANNYQSAAISIINPESGAIEGIIDLRGLLKEIQDGLDTANEVLNGIAYKKNEDRLFVTGKHWNTLFEIELVQK